MRKHIAVVVCQCVVAHDAIVLEAIAITVVDGQNIAACRHTCGSGVGRLLTRIRSTFQDDIAAFIGDAPSGFAWIVVCQQGKVQAHAAKDTRTIVDDGIGIIVACRWVGAPSARAVVSTTDTTLVVDSARAIVKNGELAVVAGTGVRASVVGVESSRVSIKHQGARVLRVEVLADTQAPTHIESSVEIVGSVVHRARACRGTSIKLANDAVVLVKKRRPRRTRLCHAVLPGIDPPNLGATRGVLVGTVLFKANLLHVPRWVVNASCIFR